LTEGGIDFARYKYTAPGEREVLGENFGHDSLKRFVDDLGDILSG
jgi:hypothetical protein